ncbi:hypothetical protein OSB04_009665 [Centaurea solstitialis]|uniref:WAT1-related protein n=1 Tax=Centaurea solstitialis TaxID=347529 RepID=A0AA38WNK5_9ASTR|nr:hypothetical protein OSB04_009665 [Centaurea solstitialis]
MDPDTSSTSVGPRSHSEMSKAAGMSEFFNKGKPFFAVIFLQFGIAGMDIISKAALNEGMSNYVFVVYRHVVATIVITPFAVVFDKSLLIPIHIFTRKVYLRTVYILRTVRTNYSSIIRRHEYHPYYS